MCFGLVMLMLSPHVTMAQRDTLRTDSLGRIVPRVAAAGVPVRNATSTTSVLRVVDSLTPPISGRRAFVYSFLLPGLGQAKLGRHSAGALFFGFEMVSMAMLGKSAYDLRIAKRGAGVMLPNSFELDSDGRVKFDTLGVPIVKDSVPNRYGVPEDDERRSLVKARQLHVEDWYAMLFFSHLFAAADALVAAQLWDVPKQVEFRRLPNGDLGVGARIHFR